MCVSAMCANFIVLRYIMPIACFTKLSLVINVASSFFLSKVFQKIVRHDTIALVKKIVKIRAMLAFFQPFEDLRDKVIRPHMYLFSLRVGSKNVCETVFTYVFKKRFLKRVLKRSKRCFF